MSTLVKRFTLLNFLSVTTLEHITNTGKGRNNKTAWQDRREHLQVHRYEDECSVVKVWIAFFWVEYGGDRFIQTYKNSAS